jgi:hypothetical protein
MTALATHFQSIAVDANVARFCLHALGGLADRDVAHKETRRAPIPPAPHRVAESGRVRARAGRDAAPALPPRLLSREAAAAYCGCDSLSTFDDWVRRGIIPRPLPGTHRWDRRAIDTALDKAGGLVKQDDNNPDRFLESWMDKQNAC